MSTKTWLVRLIPLSPFFFGSERNFSAGSDPGKANYISRSNYFPQQTSLLGMLRYELLLQYGLLPISNKNSGTVSKIIGDASFDPSSSYKQNFGYIKRLSPVFIQNVRFADGVWNTQKRFFRAALEAFEHGENQKTYMALKSDKARVSFNRNSWHSFSSPLAPYSGKHNIEPSLVEWGGNNHIPFDYDKDNQPNGLFVSDWRIGITKKDREEAFYKQRFYRFASAGGNDSTCCYCFAFYVELEDSVSLRSDRVVSIGGDRSSFKLITQQIMPEKPSPFYNSEEFYGALYYNGYRGTDKIVLLSDSVVDAQAYQYVHFAVTQGLEFRNTRATVADTRKFGPLLSSEKYKSQRNNNTTSDVPFRGEGYYLLSAGSVFYTETPSEISKLLNAQSNFQTIGYNQYRLIPKI